MFGLISAAVIVAGLWAYNAWPEWSLYRLGRSLEMPPEALSGKIPLPDRVAMVREELAQQYAHLCLRTKGLWNPTPSPVACAFTCDEMVARLTTCQDQFLEHHAGDRYVKLESSAIQLRKAFVWFERIAPPE